MTIPGGAPSLFFTTAAAEPAGDYAINRSLRFNSADSAYLNRTPGSAGNRNTFTVSFWVKLCEVPGSYVVLFGAGSGGSDSGLIRLNYESSGKLNLAAWNTDPIIRTAGVLRDFSAWYHIVVAVDTVNGTASNRAKIYINGTEATYDADNRSSISNLDTPWNNNVLHTIGKLSSSSGYHPNAYFADFQNIDGQALAPTDFGLTDSNGVWQAKAYSGSYNTNGFHLKFADNSTDSALGTDSSGNSNTWTVNNLTAVAGETEADKSFDVVTYTGNGGTKVIGPVYSNSSNSSIINAAQIFNGSTGNGGYFPGTGTNKVLTTSPFTIKTQLRIYNNFRSDGTYAICLNDTCVNVAGSGTNSTVFRWSTVDLSSFSLPLDVTKLGYSLSQNSGNTLMAIEVDSNILIDGDGTTLSFSPDFLWIKSRNSTYDHYLQDSVRGATKTLEANQTGAETTNADGVSSFDANGFSVGAGTGYTAANVNNINYVAWAWNAGANSNKTYTVKVVSDSGNKYRFDDFGTSAVTLDLAEGSTYVFDQSDSSNSGHPLRFSTTSNGTHGGGSEYTTGVTVTGTPGSAGAKTTIVVASGAPVLFYYCTQHSGMGGQANTNTTAGASNFDGSVQSVVKASQAKGFSITKFAVGTAPYTVGHGLASAPKMIILKSTSSSTNWVVYHESTGNQSRTYLNLTLAASSGENYLNNTSPTSSVFTLASSGEFSGNMIAYCWSEIAGFSKFGNYTGNGSADGPVINTGFKPALIMYRRTDSSGYWRIMDNTRDPQNPAYHVLFPNTSDAESTSQGSNQYDVDFLSNGFKIKTTLASSNASGGTFIYMAFAANFTNPECDSLVDTPEQRADQTDSGAGGTVVGNYATLNPLVTTTNNDVSLSNGNLLLSKTAATGWSTQVATVPFSSGKWYVEVAASDSLFFGIASADINFTINALQDSSTECGKGYVAFCDNGLSKIDANARQTYSSAAGGTTLGMAVDFDSYSVTWYKNGVSQGALSFSSSNIVGKQAVVFITAYANSSTFTFNFGARPFHTAAPTGFKALNTANLPTPTIADGSLYFDTKLYTGNGAAGSRAITGLSFAPDFSWFKGRSYSISHLLYDSVRGAGASKSLVSNGTNSEGSAGDNATYGYLESFDSAGFSIYGGSDVNNGYVNKNSATYASWHWDAGSSTVTNTDGSISSQVRANPTAGFSIVTWTGNASTATIGHGLNAAPELILLKFRGGTSNWSVYHSASGNTKRLLLNSNSATSTSSTYWNDTSPTSSVFSVGGDVNDSTTIVAYCFTSVAGYSAFGSYTGNGSTDGPFVFTGMRPSLVIQKRTDGTGFWRIRDTKRSTYNAIEDVLYPDTSASTITEDPYDFLSNGFKIRTSGPHNNANGGSYIYIAFAENPFQAARAR